MAPTSCVSDERGSVPAGRGTTGGAATAAPPLVVALDRLDRTALPLAGGKAANLGELIAAGFPVPDGFVVSTAAYRAAAEAVGLDAVLDAAPPSDLAGRARAALLGATLPAELAATIGRAYAALGPTGESAAVAVRSSATAEDLPDASFAGQQDTYLDVVGLEALLEAVRRCWASLWTERAVAYRAANGIDQRAVLLAVVVQRMVPATAAGVLFTANPLTGRRRQAVIDAAAGLGEAVVSGGVNPEHFVVEVDDGRIVERRPGDGPALSDERVRELARLGAAVEAHYGAPQDIEWAYAPDGSLWLLQARPITTLFPLPERAGVSPTELRVYFSASVAQGVLGPLTPAGLDGLRRFGGGIGRVLGFQTDPRRGPEAAVEAAGRLYFDVTPLIRHRLGRRGLLAVLGIMEAQSGKVIRGLLGDPRLEPLPGQSTARVVGRVATVLIRNRVPARVVGALLRPAAARANRQREVARLIAAEAARPATPREALERAEALIARTPRVVARIFPVGLAGLASLELARRIASRFGAGEEALLATRGLPHNPTTEMNLELWRLAAGLRRDAAVAELLATTPAAELADRYRAGELPPAAQAGVAEFLRRYGFRGVAEIDLGVPRWREDPTHVFGVLANYVRLDDPRLEPDAQFRRAAAEADAAIGRVVGRARRDGPLGPLRAALLRFLFGRARALAGLRELPKVTFVRALDRARELLLVVGVELATSGRLERPDDVFFLSLAEAGEGLAGREYRQTVAQRREQHAREQRRRLVPRILLSDGTALYGNEGEGEDPAGADLRGAPASAGRYTGRARVILEPAGARLEPGEVLVAPSTDPGWTPLFLTAGALVMEMGGMMSHGSVVAREYGIPAVVGALGATTTITTGQRITVDGSLGVVTIEEE